MLSQNTFQPQKLGHLYPKGVQISLQGTHESLAIKYLLSVLLVLLTQLNDLVDVVVGTEVKGTNVHLDVVLQKVFSQTCTRALS